jgi:predicted transglutaminase-like cysteine proteinase
MIMTMARFVQTMMLVSLVVVSHASVAAPLSGAQSTQFGDVRRGAWIAEGDYALAPIPFVRFCMSNPTECASDGRTGHVALDAAAWQELNEINTMVNQRISPNYAQAGRLEWSLSTAYGDCNDYAVQKRHELLSRGWPASALSLAVVTTALGEGHLVLTVRTDRGDIVLDNLRSRIVAWNATGYRFSKRQSASQPNYWVEVKGRRAKPDGEAIALRTPPEEPANDAAKLSQPTDAPTVPVESEMNPATSPTIVSASYANIDGPEFH